MEEYNIKLPTKDLETILTLLSQRSWSEVNHILVSINNQVSMQSEPNQVVENANPA